MAACFITLEGIDGSGKSTQAAMLAAALRERGCEVLLLREPGGTAISERIRELVLDPVHPEMSPQCELMLYEAARAQLVSEVIKPALEAGITVVCDRFFDSTTAYQAYGAGLDIARVELAHSLAVEGCVPALTLVYDVPLAQARLRLAARSDTPDRMEAKDSSFQERVAVGFRAIAARTPSRVKIIDATGTPDEVFTRTFAAYEVCCANRGA